MDNAPRLAGVMELVDVPDSKSGARKGVGVRVPPPASTLPYVRFARFARFARSAPAGAASR